MLQADLFAPPPVPVKEPVAPAAPQDMTGIVDLLSTTCERPRYNFMLLTLIAEASARTGSAGPYVRDGARTIPIRDWLCDAMSPLARQEPRRLSTVAKVRQDLAAAGVLPSDHAAAEQMIAAEVKQRMRRSGRTNVSRAVSELVRAGLLRRHYQGYRVDHHNRGAQRHAVYTITEETRRALAQVG